MNLAIIPGITNPSLTTHLINTCETRADALAIIDLEGDYQPNTENTDDEKDRLPKVEGSDGAVAKLKDRKINSSYGCAYFPWVQIRDTSTNVSIWAPPSVVALGTMASSDSKSEVWFAPAGFNRGGLTEGSAGLPVIQARQRLTSKDRDKLYEANINPIATFPSEGLVIFGQKTLQVTPSALDRINVRRLLIFVKKEISRISTQILFDQNNSVTWYRFKSKAVPFLGSVKSRFGLSDFKVILDETTTTPDLVDRNIMYAKIFLKPERSIEFIAIDFVITRSGASFED
jgi:phage tail sheath protein FI